MAPPTGRSAVRAGRAVRAVCGVPQAARNASRAERGCDRGLAGSLADGLFDDMAEAGSDGEGNRSLKTDCWKAGWASPAADVR
ncbi:hypothetical protein FHX80_111780 [Streptomyces brevispora]|uniref:Uncharacterized protein n=1 Tax=Streptomyces brevispora TaxID=887462 RepID=A0A561UVI4_9ACTN|nr:hypothetical protein FHX80_111780 [Streptomyces brevispora]